MSRIIDVQIYRMFLRKKIKKHDFCYVSRILTFRQ